MDPKLIKIQAESNPKWIELNQNSVKLIDLIQSNQIENASKSNPN